VSTATDFPRQINQRNHDGKSADDLANCTDRFPIHGMIHVIANIQSQSAVSRKAAGIIAQKLDRSASHFWGADSALLTRCAKPRNRARLHAI
jgi:hypothetical protein